MEGVNGIPLKEILYLAVPSVTMVPAGISAERVSIAFSPGITGLGSSEAEINLKRDLPEEQSRIVFWEMAGTNRRAVSRYASIYLVEWIRLRWEH
jgi:hypothetical protein